MRAKFSLDQTFDHTTSTRSVKIRWTQIGEASNPPLIFIHGTPWSSAEWEDLAAVLMDHYCIYLYDHPGFEESPQIANRDGSQPSLDPGLSLRAEASAALFRSWNLGELPHIIAHDNGGLVSLRLFLEHHVQFASLCLIDVVAIGPFGLPLFELVAKNLDTFQKIPGNFAEGFIRTYIKSASYKALTNYIEDRLAAQWLEGGSQGPHRFWQEIVQAHNRTTDDLERKYGSVGQTIPVKVIWGKSDSWIPSENAARLSLALNAKEVVLIEEAGHLVQYDRPDKLALEVGLWLKANAYKE